MTMVLERAHAGERVEDIAVPPVLGPRVRRTLAGIGWSIVSIALFAGVWEAAWAFGWVNPLLMPPPHIFLSDIPGTLKFFDNKNRVGSVGDGGGVIALLTVIGWTTTRVVTGLSLGFVMGVMVGAAIRYFTLFRNLTLPALTLLAPISPVAWLPVAIFLFGIGDKPAIFLVFISVFFLIVLATIHQIESVPRTYIHISRIMGATRWQTFRHVVLPAILPGLFQVLRMNLFAAWMVVLIAEVVGVGSGLVQIVSMARSTFNAKLVFFTMAVIGVCGFMLDFALRQVQRKVLWWVGPAEGAHK